ncbi:transmembrane protein 183A isoform X3 [Camelus dromedarius]|uniref:Transmembrane protein 183A isoform X4 n=2 Tax=Camelus TaxID=9836 RepID=A0A8B8RYP8_CAMFR|nr:transmembrane protein 183A isoform X4 [Vicugna pacos]XP_031294710.1 transmembrane protein 183A isoform X4 [Camelus dromedarius]XP_032322607.1 transmembrane protein 183A isoform X4 [Camelus ferus]
MARGPGPLTQPRPETVAMPKRGKRLKFRAQDACSGRVTVADYANSDPAVVRSGRVKKAVANAVQQEVKSLCGLEASQVPAVEALSGAGEPCDIIDSSDEIDAHEESIHERAVSRKKKSKRHKEDLDGAGGEEYPMDIWLLLASYIRPEDIVNFSLICKNAWTVTCTAAFWTRLYRRHYTLDASLPLRLRPESMEKLRCLRACVIRSLYHMYEPFAARISKNPAIPESTPSTLKNSKHSLCGTLEPLCWQQKCLPLKAKPIIFDGQQDVQGMSGGQDSWHGGRPTPCPLGVLTFLVQKDCWKQTGTNVGIQLQVQKTVP